MWPLHVFKHAEMLSETRRVQCVSEKSVAARARKPHGSRIHRAKDLACKGPALGTYPQAQQFKNRTESPDWLLLNAL